MDTRWQATTFLNRFWSDRIRGFRVPLRQQDFLCGLVLTVRQKQAARHWCPQNPDDSKPDVMLLSDPDGDPTPSHHDWWDTVLSRFWNNSIIFVPCNFPPWRTLSWPGSSDGFSSAAWNGREELMKLRLQLRGRQSWCDQLISELLPVTLMWTQEGFVLSVFDDEDECFLWKHFSVSCGTVRM